MKARCVWLGPFPAHYIRALHRNLERQFPGLIAFFYCPVEELLPDRAYEVGDLPENHRIFRGKSRTICVLSHLRRLNPALLIVSGHFPRALLWGALWSLAQGRRVWYWSDTNSLDVLRLPRPARWLRQIALRPVLRRMDRLLYMGTRNRDYYRWVTGPGYSEDRLGRLPCPAMIGHVMPATMYQDAEASEGIFRFTYLGRLVEVKCVSNLIKAFSRLPIEQQSRSRLDIFGDGPERPRLEREVAQFALGAKVILHGAIASDRAALAFRRANVLVLPSAFEAWGIVINEAMASGVPVIAPHWIGAVADLVRHGETGLVAANNSPEELASAMTWAVLNREAMYDMGQKARDLIVRQGWSLEGATIALCSLLSGALLAKDQRHDDAHRN